MGIQLLMNRPDLLLQGLYDRRKPVKVLIHGFTGNGTTDGFVTKAAQGIDLNPTYLFTEFLLGFLH